MKKETIKDQVFVSVSQERYDELIKMENLVKEKTTEFYFDEYGFPSLGVYPSIQYGAKTITVKNAEVSKELKRIINDLSSKITKLSEAHAQCRRVSYLNKKLKEENNHLVSRGLISRIFNL